MAASAAQKMKFSIKEFFSKCDQIRSFLCSVQEVMLHLLGNRLGVNRLGRIYLKL